MESSGVQSSSQASAANPTGHDAFKDLDLNTFIKLLIAELQNQDPLNPMDNNQLLQQVSQIREIESNTRLTDTLSSVLLGQNLSTASSLINRTITGLTQDSDKITGVVDRVSIEDERTILHIGDQRIELKNVAEILPEEEGLETNP